MKQYKIKAGELGFVQEFDICGVSFRNVGGLMWNDERIAQILADRLNRVYGQEYSFQVVEA